MTRRAHFDWRVVGDALFIVDREEPGRLSVTNDAERVIDAMRYVLGNTGCRRVIYRDTDGRWDCLQVDPRSLRFFDFLVLDARTALRAYRMHCALFPSIV